MIPPQIRFSHSYYKFAGAKLPFRAVLVQCFKVHFCDLSRCFIAYDTQYDEGEYPLPKTDLIVLLLMFDDRKLFTTMRRFTAKKWEYYKSLEGKEVEMVKV